MENGSFFVTFPHSTWFLSFQFVFCKRLPGRVVTFYPRPPAEPVVKVSETPGPGHYVAKAWAGSGRGGIPWERSERMRDFLDLTYILFLGII